MTPILVLEIIKLSLELAIQVVQHIPAEQQAKFWQRHEDRMEAWEAMLKTLQGQS
jgi:hypothetical protein